MKKKNITIDTQFFDDGLQAKLKAYSSEDYSLNNLKQQKQSKKQTNQGTSLYSYQRYEYIPDNEYSNNENQSKQTHFSNTIQNNKPSKQQNQQKQHSYQQQSQNQSSIQTSYQIKKLQSATLIQKYMTQRLSLLLMKSWNRLKALLPQYGYLLDYQDNSRDNSFKGKSVKSYYESLMSQKNKNYQYDQYNQYDHNNQYNQYDNNQYHTQHNKHNNYEHSNNLIENSFDSRSLKTNQQIKKQIILRQKNGITLDSLQKRKLQKSKSINHIKIKKNNTQNIIKSIQNYQQNKNNPEQQIHKLKGSNVLRKNYRQKFIDYKHRSRSKQYKSSFKNKIKKSYTYENIQSTTNNQNINMNNNNNININNNLNNKINTNNINSDSIKQQQNHIIHNNTNHIQQLGNLNSYNQNYHQSNYNINFHTKNQLLQNIHQLLLNRESIYQGKNAKYYINHHSSSNQKYYHNHHQQRYNNHINLHKYYQNNKYFINYQRQYQDQHNNNFDYQRIKLLKQIVDKINYSKIRYEQQKSTNHNVNSQNYKQLMKKLEKLEKIVYQLYKNNQLKQSGNIIYHNEIINEKRKILIIII